MMDEKTLQLARTVDKHFRRQMSVDFSYWSQEEHDLHQAARKIIEKSIKDNDENACGWLTKQGICENPASSHEYCQQCGCPLCHSHFIQGAGFCDLHPERKEHKDAS